MITIVGSGRVGSQIASQLVILALDDITLLDVIDGLPQAQSADLLHMASAMGVDIEIKGSNDYMDLLGSDIVIISAGSARKPGMSRLDLQDVNAGIVRQISVEIANNAPEAKVLVVTNPVDVMTYLAVKSTGFRRSHVFGLGSVVDAYRFRYYLSLAGGVSRSSVSAMVVGEHGDSMVPLARHSTIGGMSVDRVLGRSELTDSMEKARLSGSEVLLKLKGTSIFGPAAAATRIVEAVVKDRKAIMPASVMLDGEYGLRDVCIGVPVVFGKGGAEKVLELELEKEDRDKLSNSAEVVRKASLQLRTLVEA